MTDPTTNGSAVPSAAAAGGDEVVVEVVDLCKTFPGQRALIDVT